jgi:all-trans-8'-apo-beta-carotenal 15,15'-oxygenase
MSIGRRDFLRAFGLAGAAGAGALLPRPTLADPTRTESILAGPQPPWSIGFEGVTADLPPLAMQLEGKLPDACLGTLYRNGPALYERAGQRYGHWFDPDGMVQAFELSRSEVNHHGRFVRTDKFVMESEAGRFLYNGAGSQIAGAQGARSNETTNTANINIQPFNGELLALWEAGAPYRVDPNTLETRGRVSWSDELDGVPFSAHPRRDEQGNLWNIGSVPFLGRPTLVLYQLGADGDLKQWRMHSLDFAGYMHDFILTPRYLLALNSSLVVRHGENFVDSMRWEGERPSQLLVFDREDFSLVSATDVPAAFVFHFGNGWEQGDEIFFTACQHADAALVKKGMGRLARQEPGPYYDDPELLRYQLSPKTGRFSIERLGMRMEFPGFDQRSPFKAQPLYGVGTANAVESVLSSAVLRVDPLTAAVDRYDYGRGTIVEEPLYIPGPEGGYLLHSWLNYERERSGLSVLRAANLADGPIAVAQMDRVLPLGFHGCFVGGA